jgi:hypothetical protein
MPPNISPKYFPVNPRLSASTISSWISQDNGQIIKTDAVEESRLEHLANLNLHLQILQ